MKPLSERVGTDLPRDRILYVEDEEANWDVVELRLGRAYEVCFARNSQEAFKKLRAEPAFSAILMDVQLRGSDHDGLELAGLLRGGEAADECALAEGVPEYCREVPIVFVTAFTDDETRSRVECIHNSSFVSKPIDFSQLTLFLARSHLARLGA